jgi:hypothetical protein
MGGLKLELRRSILMSGQSEVMQPRLLLPLALAAAVIRGSSMPWITVRTFSGNERVYNLSDLRGGIAVVMTIVLFVLVGAIVGIFKRMTGMTIMSLSVATLGWMAAISGMLLSLLWSLIPSINVAGLDLAKATLSQGTGVVVTVVSSLALAFMVVRQLEPLKSYSPTTEVPMIPVAALAPIIAIAWLMHSEWLRLGSTSSNIEAQIAGDALYGSGLVVLGLWLSVGLWIGALMVNRSLMISVASALSVVISLIVGMYAIFMWAGGRLLDWLVPAKLENWAAVAVEPQLYLVLVSCLAMLILSTLGLFPRMHLLRFRVGTRVQGNSGLFLSDVVGGSILLVIAGSVVWQLL